MPGLWYPFPCGMDTSFGISTSFEVLSPSERQVAYALLTRLPLGSIIASYHFAPFDLHVLSTPPAFNLSQNQTLQFKSVAKISVGTEIRISKFFPTRSSLVNEPCALSFGARSVSTLPFAACQLLFSIFRKFLFGIARSFSPPRNSFLRKFRLACQDFFSLS